MRKREGWKQKNKCFQEHESFNFPFCNTWAWHPRIETLIPLRQDGDPLHKGCPRLAQEILLLTIYTVHVNQQLCWFCYHMSFETGDKANMFSPLLTALHLLLMESAKNLGSQEMQGNYREDQGLQQCFKASVLFIPSTWPQLTRGQSEFALLHFLKGWMSSKALF